jgi:putative Ca2+/H+ antiporter (TMEM165/GDT1 family)
MADEKSEYAKQLLDEWKYRHDLFFKLAFRYSWVAIVLAVLPSLTVNSPIGEEFFKHVREGDSAVWAYWGLIVGFFACANWHLYTEYKGKEAVRKEMLLARNTVLGLTDREDPLPKRKPWRRFLPSRVGLIHFLYVVAFLSFFFGCWYYQRQQPKPVLLAPCAQLLKDILLTSRYNMPSAAGATTS